MSEYTKGPWRWDRLDDLRSSNDEAIVEGANYFGNDDSAAYANKSLIAAAPEMYEALKVTREALIGEFGQRIYLVNFGRIEESIAKAEGL
jgi:hypothetical protein